MLAWQNFAGQADRLPGWRWVMCRSRPLSAETQTARMDLVFSLGERLSEAGEPAGIGGSVEFRTDVFDAASIEVLIERLARVLAALTADPARRCRRWMCSMKVSMPGSMGSATGRCWPEPVLRRCRFRWCSPSRWPVRRRRWR